MWVNYAVPGIRIELERTNPDGPVQGGGGLPFDAPQRQILVVGGTRAWNETIMPGGPATPAFGQEKDRAAQIWMLPEGAVKAARMAGDKLVLGMEAGKLTLTFPLPAPSSNYIEKVRLDARKLIEHVEVMVDNPLLGDTKLEADYDNYKDPDLSDIPFPFHIVQKLGDFPFSISPSPTRGCTTHTWSCRSPTSSSRRTPRPWLTLSRRSTFRKSAAASISSPARVITASQWNSGPTSRLSRVRSGIPAGSDVRRTQETVPEQENQIRD